VCYRSQRRGWDCTALAKSDIFNCLVIILIITGPLNGPVLFCLLASVVVVVVCRHYLSSSVMLRAGRAHGLLAAAGRMSGRSADTARRASTVTSR